MTVSELELDLDLDVFAGPFDLLLAVVLREEVSLLELQLGEVVVAYVDHLEEMGELDLEVATEFLVLIASLLELKSRLLLPGADEGLEELGSEEAIDELLARLLEYRRYSAAAAVLVERFEAAAKRIDERVARRLIGKLAGDFIIRHILGDIDQDLIGLRPHA